MHILSAIVPRTQGPLITWEHFISLVKHKNCQIYIITFNLRYSRIPSSVSVCR